MRGQVFLQLQREITHDLFQRINILLLLLIKSLYLYPNLSYLGILINRKVLSSSIVMIYYTMFHPQFIQSIRFNCQNECLNIPKVTLPSIYIRHTTHHSISKLYRFESFCRFFAQFPRCFLHFYHLAGK